MTWEKAIAPEPAEDSESIRTRDERLQGVGLHDFDRVLIKAIEETISSLLSKRVLDALYEHLARYHSITRDELPVRLETLHAVMGQAIGYTASATIERAIARGLYSRLNMRFKNSSSSTLLEYVNEAKRNLVE